MTDKIEQLWEETTITTFPRHGKYASVYPDHIKEFAEAIVKECLSVMNEQFWSDGHEINEAMEIIKAHFGVEG
jgi:hypothetical protein